MSEVGRFKIKKASMYLTLTRDILASISDEDPVNQEQVKRIEGCLRDVRKYLVTLKRRGIQV